jgi:exosortase E/protease (VPEID-CTERM system)
MFPQAFILLPSGVLAMWLSNALRITLLLLIGTYVSPEIALVGFHNVGGWLGLIAVALIMVAVSQQIPFFTRSQSQVKSRIQESDLTAAYLAPLMALLVIIMVTRALTITFDWLYPLRVLGTVAVIWFFWRSKISQFRFSRVWSGSAICIGVVVYIVWVGIDWVTGNKETGRAISDSLQEMPTWFAATWLIFRVLGSVITVPIAEELAFRGYALRRMISSDFDKVSLRFTWFSFLLSSFLFGVLHGRWVAGTVAGMFYAWAMYRRGKVGDAIIAHATTNALIAAHVLILGNWNYWN